MTSAQDESSRLFCCFFSAEFLTKRLEVEVAEEGKNTFLSERFFHILTSTNLISVCQEFERSFRGDQDFAVNCFPHATFWKPPQSY